MPKKGSTLYEKIKDKLEKEGFEVTIFESLMDKAKKVPNKNAIVWKDDRNQMKWMDFIGHDENC